MIGKARERLCFCRRKITAKEKWNGVRMSPTDPGIEARTGFATVMAMPELRATVERLAKIFPNFYTILPYQKEMGGYPHERETRRLAENRRAAARPERHSQQHHRLADHKSRPTEIAFIRRPSISP